MLYIILRPMCAPGDGGFLHFTTKGVKLKIRKIGSLLEKAALFVTRPGIAGFSVFLLLLILNCDSLTAPPFWDDIIGLHTQAVWLARNNFDFSALAAFESSSGTPCYNLLSPLALFYALCYRFLSPVMTHTAAHLVNIISIAGCSFFLMQMTRKCSLSVRAAALAGALTTPLIVSACAGTGQESVLALLIMAGLNWYSCKKDLRSWASSIGAWFIKLTAVFLTASFAADKVYDGLCDYWGSSFE